MLLETGIMHLSVSAHHVFNIVTVVAGTCFDVIENRCEYFEQILTVQTSV